MVKIWKHNYCNTVSKVYLLMKLGYLEDAREDIVTIILQPCLEQSLLEHKYGIRVLQKNAYSDWLIPI